MTMAAVVLIAIGLPCLICALAVSIKQRTPRLCTKRLCTNADGIALQTVIIMVVLIAIAGAVAAVLVTRGGEAVDEIRSTNIAQRPANFNNETLCAAAGFHWNSNSGTCQAQAAPGPPSPPPPQPLPSYTTESDCDAKNHDWSGSPPSCKQNSDKSAYTLEADCTEGGGTWAPAGDPNGRCTA